MPILSAERAARDDSRQSPYTATGGSGASYSGPSSGKAKEKGRKAPTVEDILERAKEVEDFWEPRNERMQRHQELYDLREKPSEKRGQMKIYPNDPRVVLRKVAGMSARRKFRIEAPPKGEHLADSAQRIENWCRWWERYTNRQWVQGLHNNLNYDESMSLFKRGWIATRVMLNPDDETFTSCDLFDPYTIYPKPRGRGYQYVCHIYEATVDELLWDFPDAPKSFKQMDGKHKLKVIAYYEGDDPHWFAVVAGEDFIKKPAKLGYFPWIIQVADGEISHEDNGMPYNDADLPARVGCSFLDALESTYKKLSQFVTIFANIAAKQENPARVWNTQSGQPQAVSLEAGADNWLLVGEGMRPVDIGAKAASLLVPMIQFFQQGMDKASLPSALFGANTSSSGYDRALMMGAAEDTLWTYMEALAAYKARKMQRALEIYEKFGTKPVPFVSKAPRNRPQLLQANGMPMQTVEPGRMVWGDELSVEDVTANGTYIEVIFEDISPQDRVALGQLAVMLVEKGLMSAETARDKLLGMDDPGLENDRILSERVYLHPDAIKILMRQSMRSKGMDREIEALDMAEQKAQQQMLGAGGLSSILGPDGRPLAMPNNDPGNIGISPEGLPPEMAGVPEAVPNDEQLIAALQMAAMGAV